MCHLIFVFVKNDKGGRIDEVVEVGEYFGIFIRQKQHARRGGFGEIFGFECCNGFGVGDRDPYQFGIFKFAYLFGYVGGGSFAVFARWVEINDSEVFVVLDLVGSNYLAIQGVVKTKIG